METRIRIFRSYGPEQTTGKAWVELHGSYPIFDFYTLELPWKDNQKRISCIPEGQYKWIKHESPKFGSSLWVQDVPGRSEILMHVGNFTKDTLGCILPGDGILDINGDGILDVTNSRKTMKTILEKVSNSGEIWIESI